ncbi:MetQ/NlpA family ABC transporter substrate-binding protein [Pontibacillus litoralis]|uniref:Lipoprotein n=1 Tax=Pontibacillus litoralis JSM 072002 TaxID=1385512 RepID=A0A0A5G3M7_9BACI|nr:MetQ/NlpA family ABC transporter substrate-binding protein [Pontibacillus litoralis]KGX85743.1 methionine ABC transporter substrate-binding protein [Pontibacillus litoralis JSM 072002]
MKRTLLLIISTLFIGLLAACGTSNEEASGGDTTTITLGATSVPHAEILEEAKPILEEKGIEVKIETYQDYVLPNKDLDNGTIDANFYQHIPYLEDQKKEFGYDFVNVGPVHIEPMGVYSKSITTIDDIPAGTEVIMSRSVADHGRVLSLFETQGIITLKDGIDKQNATVEDIKDNPKNLEFSADVDPGFLPQTYEREEDALVAINTNYAIEGGLIPAKDALFIEGGESPYSNILVTTSEQKENAAILTVLEVLQSEEMTTFIEQEYNGAIVPVK